MPVAKDKMMTSIVLPKELKASLDEISKSEMRSFNNLVTVILTEYVEKKKKTQNEFLQAGNNENHN